MFPVLVHFLVAVFRGNEHKLRPTSGGGNLFTKYHANTQISCWFVGIFKQLNNLIFHQGQHNQ